MATYRSDAGVATYLGSISDQRRGEARLLIDTMQDISGEEPYMYGSSIIGFGTVHYKYDSGREGDMPKLAFSSRKANLTIYINEGFDAHAASLEKLGKHKTSVSCLYINKLENADLTVLRHILEQSYARSKQAA